MNLPVCYIHNCGSGVCVEGTGGRGVNSYFRNEAKCRFFVFLI